MNKNNENRTLFLYWKSFREKNIFMVVILLWIVLAIGSGGKFVSASNLSNLIRQSSISGVVAVAMTFVIVSAGIDLSVGSIIGFSGTLFAMLVSQQYGLELPILLAIIIGIIAAVCVGTINGILIFDGKIQPFIATLGTMTVFRGVTNTMMHGRIVSGLPESVVDFSAKSFLGFSSLAWIWLAVILIASFVFKYTKFGRDVYATGSNAEASRLAGINLRRVNYSVYALSGLLCGIAGLMFISRVRTATVGAGSGSELDAIAAAVIGGTSMGGGAGTVLGTVIGTLLIQTIRNGGNLLGLSSFVMQIIIGLIILASVFFDERSKSAKKK